MRKECEGCPRVNEPICCNNRPKLSRAFNFFNLPKTVEQAKADEVQRKCQLGTLVVGDMQ